MAEALQVYLVDDDEAIRRSATFMLRTAGFRVESFESGDAFMKGMRHLEPGAVLLDIRMPGASGLDVQQAMNEHGITLPVIIMTGHGDVPIAVQAMKAGAVDFIEKPFEKSVLVNALENARARLESGASARRNEQEAQTIINGLTVREREVLQGLAKGHPNKTIAYDLGISPRTVEVHRANVMAKMGVRSLSDALRIAFAAGIEAGE
ncbi:MAG: response regulator [Sphingobium sp.]|nr:response regulator [Sphingobium sp.]